MSLFQIREWWRCKPTEAENCGHRCLCVANIDHSSDTRQKIIYGSYEGVLHIYQVSDRSTGKQQHSDDLLLEVNLQHPILQVACGNFVSASAGVHLAVLHPRLLVVYKVTIAEGAVDHGKQCTLAVAHQHKLERTAANLTFGPFGGVKNQDFICIQSMDGALSLFEHEAFMFTRFLPSFLLPGPLTYNAYNDSFLTVSSQLALESYSYQVLASAVEGREREVQEGGGSSLEPEQDQSIKNQNLSKGIGKKLTANWTLNLGEAALQISVVVQDGGKPVIVVLGERSLYFVEIGGKLRLMKKLEANPSCMKVMQKNPSSGIQVLLATHANQLLIYRNAKLEWAAKMSTIPVCLEIATIRNIDGLLIFLEDDGQATCCYLGTTPSIFSLTSNQQRTANIDELDKKINHYRSEIKRIQEQSIGDEVLLSKEDLVIDIQLPDRLDGEHVEAMHDIQIHSDENASVTCQVLLQAPCRVYDINVSVEPPPLIQSSVQQTIVPTIAGGDTETIEVCFTADKKLCPKTLNVDITVNYKDMDGTHKVAMDVINLPLKLVASVSMPLKKLEHKVTIETDVPCFDLVELFSEFESEENNASIIGIQYRDGAKLSILAAKSGTRYRVQCERYTGLWLFVSALVERVKAKNPHVEITTSDKPMLDEMVSLIDEHFQCRYDRDEVKTLLEHRAQQYRIVQRRLLARFKDKTPSSLNCLDTLLEGTHLQLLTLIDSHEEYDTTLARITSELNSVSMLIVLLIKLTYNLSEEEEEILKSTLWVNHAFTGSGVAGWEESVDMSLVHLFKTTLQKSQEAPISGMQQVLSMPQDTVKVKKHLAILVDRLSKGLRLVQEGRKSERKKVSFCDSSPITYGEANQPVIPQVESATSVNPGDSRTDVSKRGPSLVDTMHDFFETSPTT